MLPFSASQARTGVFSAVTGHRPRHGVDGGRRAWALPWPRPAAPAEPIRIGVTPGTPILGRRRPRHGPSAVSPAFGRGNDFQRHRIFLLLHRTSGGCAQDSPRIHPAVMPHPARGAGHPQRAVNHPAGGPRRRPFLWIDAWTPPQPEFETTQCTPWSHPWGSYPRSSNTKPPSAPAWAVRRQTSFRRRKIFLLFPRPPPTARA